MLSEHNVDIIKMQCFIEVKYRFIFRRSYMETTYLQRLSFIKYLFSIGITQSYQPEPLCGVAILSFHDSIELFLCLASEKLDKKRILLAL